MVLFPQAEPQRSRNTMQRALLGVLFAIIFGWSATASASDVQGTIDFDVENLPKGTILSEVDIDLGGGASAGPVSVHGTLPGFPQNRAVIFDSSLRTGGDTDLGTPNQDFGGPGIGNGGGTGSQFPNDQEQLNILIVAEDLVDADNDGLVDDPDDGTLFGMLLEFDFRSIQAPFRPAAVTVYSITTVDLSGGNPGEVRFYDDNGLLIATEALVSTGNNALNTVTFGPGGSGVFGAARMEVQLNESSGIDDIVMELHSDPAPNCDISESGPITVTVGEEVCFDVTGSVGTPMATVCNGMGVCAPRLTPTCGESANVHWDFTGCMAFSDNQNFSEFVPTIDASCPGVAVSASVVSQSQHSCNSDVLTGAGGGAMCVPVSTNANYDPNDTAKTLTFDVTVTESDGNVATVEDFSFFHSAGTWVTQHQTGGSPTSFSNDPPEFYALRVLRDGVAILLLEDLPISDVWVQTEYEFSDPAFQVTNTTAVFTFELYAYAAAGNSAQLRIWDLDEFDVNICCSDANPACPDTVTIAQTKGAAGAVATPALPLDSSPNPSATTTVCWTPTGADIGAVEFMYSVTDCKGEVSVCSIDVIVVCDLEFNAGGQPDDLEVCEGDTATFMVDALQNPDATTQWFRDGVAIPGATSDTLMLTNVQVSDAGTYTAVLTSVCGMITSDPAVLTVNTPPEVTLDATPVEECEGGAVMLNGSSTGTMPLTYSWTKDGAVLPGETGPTLTLNPLELSDAGSYVLTASNLCGDDSSAAVVVTVLEAPSIDASPMSQTVCEGDMVTFGVMASGSSPLAYQWFLDGAAIPGATGAMLSLPAASTSDAGNYTVAVSNTCDTVTAGPATLTVRTAPSITAQPMDVTECAGTMATLSFMVDGSTPLTIAWFQDGVLIPGETGTSLSIAALSAGDAGSYTATVSNDCGMATTNAAVVTVLEAPTITAQPMDETLCEGEDLTLSVTATGSAPLAYQWSFNGMPIPGATSATLMIPGVTTANDGSYTVDVSNSCDSVTSAAAVVTVRTAPTITAQPQDATDCEGATIVLSITATGSEPLTIAWAKDGVPIPGETMTTLTIANAMAADSGSYTATVSNDCGTAISDAAVVVVLEAPEITAQPMGEILCEGDTLNLSVMATGSAPLSYQWFRDGAAIPGATMATLSVPSVTTADAGSYTVEVSNTCDTVASNAADVTVRTAPMITAQPQGVTDCEGATIALSVTASGSEPLTYAWAKDGVPIPGATMATLMIPNAMATDSGSYTVTVTNDCGMAMSAAAVVVVEEAPEITAQPSPATLCEGETLNLSVMASGSAPLSYQWFLDGAAIPGATMATYSVAGVTTADAGSYTVQVSNTCGMVTSAPAAVEVRTAPMITTQPMGGNACTGTMFSLSVTATGSDPLSYQWFLDGVAIPGETGAMLSLASVALADGGTYTVAVTNDCGTATSDGAVLVVDEPRTITVPPQSQTVCEGDMVTFTVTATGTAPLSTQWRLDGVDIPGATMMTLTIPAASPADSGSYDVVITNDCGSDTSAPATLTVQEAPVVTSGPMGATACVGDSVVLSVTATGSLPLSYQWTLNGMNIPGATMATLDLGMVDLADAGTYAVIVTNACGSATSDNAVVAVLEGPTIDVDPMSQDLCEGDTLNLMVSVSGSPPISIEWRLNGVAIPGETGLTLSIPNLMAGDAGDYSVFVMNDCGSATSADAVVNVGMPPMITIDSPASVEQCEGTSTTLMATVTGAGPLSLQWKRDGVDIPGAHDASFTIPSLMVGDGGTYTLMAMNDCGMATSSAITLTVREAPTITVQPEGGMVCPDDMNSFTFTVTATGSDPLTYTWFRDGTEVQSGPSASYTIADVMVGDYGAYTVVVSNDCGSDTSAPADLVEPMAGQCEVEIIRGDCNADGSINIADPIYIMRFSFQGFAGPVCFDPCDFNDDGVVDISDTIYAISYIFTNGPAPLAPFDVCGPDPTPDSLVCPSFSECVSP